MTASTPSALTPHAIGVIVDGSANQLGSPSEPRNFLEAHRFYLDEEQCGRVNRALARIHSDPREWNRIVVESASFAPHPAMQPIHWLDDSQSLKSRRSLI